MSTLILNDILFIFSDLKGKSAIDLGVPDSPLTNLLVRSSNENSSLLSPRTPLEINGNVNGNIQQSYRMGPVSPGVESVFSVDEVNLYWCL